MQTLSIRIFDSTLQDLDEKAAAVTAVQTQAAELAAKLSGAEAALERNSEVRTSSPSLFGR